MSHFPPLNCLLCIHSRKNEVKNKNEFIAVFEQCKWIQIILIWKPKAAKEWEKLWIFNDNDYYSCPIYHSLVHNMCDVNRNVKEFLDECKSSSGWDS